MGRFKAGLRRLRLGPTALVADGAPFTLLATERGPGGDEWLVQDWADGMESWFTGRGELREVMSLDLEEVFVELLRWARYARRSA